MNKIFKIVFNAARGKMMVVNEATSSVQTGKKAAVTVAVLGALVAGSAIAATPEYSNQTNTIDDGGALQVLAGQTKSVANDEFKSNDVTASGMWGGAIWNKGTLTVTDTVFEGNEANSGVHHQYGNSGGAIGAGTGSVTKISGSTFKENVAFNDGGAIASFGTIEIVGSTFDSNTASSDTADTQAIGGGAIAFGAESDATISSASVTNTTFKNNLSDTDGGAIGTRKAADANNSGAKLVIDATFEGNTAKKKGGAIYNTFYADGGVQVTGVFKGNKANGDGGAIFNDGAFDKSGTKGGVMTVTNAKFTENQSGDWGGAITNGGTLTVIGGTFDFNVAKVVGGAIATYGSSENTVITGATFTNNHAEEDGGAIGNYGAINISGSTFIGNTAHLTGSDWSTVNTAKQDDANSPIGGGAISLGAVSSTEITSITNTLFKENKSGYNGGAIATRLAAHANNKDAKLVVSGTFESNEAVKSGGAIYNTFYAGEGVQVTGVFTGNKAGVDGGAIFNDGAVDKGGSAGGVMTVTNSTFTGNSAAGKGGAIYNSGTLTLKGTNTFSDNTVAGNANDIYNVGTVTFADNSVTYLAGGIAGDGTGTLNGSGSIVIADAGATIAGQSSVGPDLVFSATGDVNDELGGDIKTLSENVGVKITSMEEGSVMGAVTLDAEGNVQTQVNKKTEALAEQVTLAPQMITRIMMNDVRKRMGDLRAAEGTHGVWARYNGGQMAGSGMEADFNMIQVGVDTVPVADAPRFGVAFSYAQTEAEATGGLATTDMDSFSLAFYGTKMYDNGMFVDVIGRMATTDTEMNVLGNKAKMDNVALSLSGELGWRFDVTDRFFFEPSVEATYTYTNAETFTMGSGTYTLEDVDSLVGRAGFAAGMKCPGGHGDLYVRAAVAHEFMGDATMRSWAGTREALPIVTDGKDTWFEYAIGVNVNVNKNTYVYADVERTSGANVDEDWRANVGVRFAF